MTLLLAGSFNAHYIICLSLSLNVLGVRKVLVGTYGPVRIEIPYIPLPHYQHYHTSMHAPIIHLCSISSATISLCDVIVF